MKRTVTSKSYRFTMTAIYIAQALVLLFFSIVVLFLKVSGALTPATGLTEIFYYLVPIATVAFLSTAHFIFKTLIEKIPPSLPVRQKLPKFQTAVIVRSAVLEIPGLLGAVAAMLTGELYFLAAPLFIVIVMIVLRPTLLAITQELNLSVEEKALLENPEAVVSEL
jgi:hypothetical protein